MMSLFANKKIGFPVALVLILVALIGIAVQWFSQSEPISREVVSYKKTPSRDLHLIVTTPERSRMENAALPVVMFFHGGGWVGGNPAELDAYASLVQQWGFTSVQVEYRVARRDKTSVFDAMEDARDALTFLSSNDMARFDLDLSHIYMIGASAGGHLAFWAPVLAEKTVSGLFLMSPVLDTSAVRGYGFALLNKRWKEASPLENLTADNAPMKILHSRMDYVVPAAGIEAFMERAKSVGVEAQVQWIEGDSHAFYIVRDGDMLDPDVVDALKEFILPAK